MNQPLQSPLDQGAPDPLDYGEKTPRKRNAELQMDRDVCFPTEVEASPSISVRGTKVLSVSVRQKLKPTWNVLRLAMKKVSGS